mmetsp:Transcript_121235/g.302561  ORF Transcript_121235/g.302561 Transcript_121235/m.302561 type:complete len:134 (-) Transcript_121235:287-688(-)
MGGSISSICAQEEDQPWDMRWTELEQGSRPGLKLDPSDAFLPTANPTAERAGHINHGEEEYMWDTRWSQLEQSITRKAHREAMAVLVQSQLQQLRSVDVQDMHKEEAPRATKSNKDVVEEQAVVLAVAHAGGA